MAHDFEVGGSGIDAILNRQSNPGVMRRQKIPESASQDS
jgi:hypothetical protein